MKTQSIFLNTLVALLIIAMVGCVPRITKDEIRRGADAIWNKGDLDLVDKYNAPNFVSHSPGQSDIQGNDAYKQHIRNIRSAFPDLHFTIEDIVIEGDRVAIRWTLTGTNKGPLKTGSREIPPTGKTLKETGMAFWKIQSGKIVEEFSISDALGAMQQLGLIPAPK